MRQVRLLPVAPRPCDDELLSCWHWRVASHYSTSPPQVESWIMGSLRGQNQDFFSRDFHPDQAAIQLWARACRAREGDLDRLSLRGARRPKTSFVSDPMDRGVCPVCLDEDAEEGRDHYCRRWWARVEAVVCPRHGIGLENNCARCFRSGLFQFRQTPAGVVRLFCRYCGAVVSARGFQRRDQFDMVEIASVISEAIENGGEELARIATASCFLWSPTPEGTPPSLRWVCRCHMASVRRHQQTWRP
ncbi:TniQ family protein [Rhizobium johnstonii]